MDYLQSMGADNSSPIKPLQLEQGTVGSFKILQCTHKTHNKLLKREFKVTPDPSLDDVKHTSLPALKGDSGLGASTSIFNLSLPQDQ